MANPTAVLRSGVSDAAPPGRRQRREPHHAALAHVYTEKKHVTRDVGGTAGTSEFADAMIEALHTIPVPPPVTREAEL